MQLLGLGILAGSCVTKLPQVLNVLKSRSAEGLSMISLELEVFVGLIHVCYGYFFNLAITAYGEAAVMWLQNLALTGIVYSIKRPSLARPIVLVTGLAMIGTPVALHLLDAATMVRLYDMNSTIYIASKLPQVIMGFRKVCVPLLQLLARRHTCDTVPSAVWCASANP